MPISPRFKQRACSMKRHSGTIRKFLLNLPDTVARHRLNTPLPKEELRVSAEAYVKTVFKTGDLACLGIGEEAVVLTDGHMVYKHFHYWNPKGSRHSPCLP